MDIRPAKGLQKLLLERLVAMGGPGEPMPLRVIVERSGGLRYEDLRAIARGERSDVLTARQAAALAAALEVPVSDVEAAATVLRQL